MRPNVVFELGWFCGRVGRSRTCILIKQPMAIPSDLHGMEYYEFSKSLRDCWADLDDELRPGGLTGSGAGSDAV